ncbi:unnamed protein product [Bursaphelenchus xylophilus]|uniref:(pine wood nematode) hypothetical protein n=1 Tax=Bursaphelenchus xylophilus TaxID=6326 RepID=A0A1I7SDN0_BURXY|nr:unnamed protein product [Bursaphelenchus xylophilus]CAG9120905.1 unnamed protein product [Bursaphelenchus xylophilus]
MYFRFVFESNFEGSAETWRRLTSVSLGFCETPEDNMPSGRSYFKEGSGRYLMSDTDSSAEQVAQSRPQKVCITCCEHGTACEVGSRASPLITQQEEASRSLRRSRDDYIFPKDITEGEKKKKNPYEMLPLAELVRLPKKPSEKSAPSSSEELSTAILRSGTYTPHPVAKKTDHLEPIYYEEDEYYENFYLGAQTELQAMTMCKEKTEFKLYHKLSATENLADLQSSLKMFVVYRTSKGGYCHLPVNSVVIDDQLFHYVECGEQDPPRFTDVESLIRFYTVYVHLRYSRGGRKVEPDVFPWWNIPKSHSK